MLSGPQSGNHPSKENEMDDALFYKIQAVKIKCYCESHPDLSELEASLRWVNTYAKAFRTKYYDLDNDKGTQLLKNSVVKIGLI